MSEMNLLIIAVVAVGAGILLIKFGQVIARFLLALGGLIVAGIIGLAFWSRPGRRVRWRRRHPLRPPGRRRPRRRWRSSSSWFCSFW
jgi:hypothetical protein